MATQPPQAAAETPAEVPVDEHGQPLSKNALKKLEKEREKAKKKADREAKEAAERTAREATEVDDAEGKYDRKFTKISELNSSMVGQKVTLQARLHNTRAQSAKLCFLVFREQTSTVQSLVSVAPGLVSKQMAKFASRLPLESIILVEGEVQAPVEPVKTCSVQDVEVKVETLWSVSEAPAQLPFSLEDASRPTADIESASEDAQFPTVSFNTRLNNRVLDLRTPVSRSIFKIQAQVCSLFRSHLESNGFMEIHSPKLQGAATESGASVFKVEPYFDTKAFLAQSPQLAKQMAIAADFERVYEIGPVFRAEDSNTARHMTEFTGLDLEMALKEHYHEALDLLDTLFIAIFEGLSQRCSVEIETVKTQHPHDDFVWLPETLRLKHSEAVQMLKDAGHEIDQGVDMSTPQEKALGELVKTKFKTDYYIIDKFPLAIRPFYTMPDPDEPTLSNSYDFFMRGEEIMSGAQRIHDAELLSKRMKEAGANPAEMKGYVDAFTLGCPPHAGGGIGLERVVMLFLKLGNIRRASLFPRDPKRLEP